MTRVKLAVCKPDHLGDFILALPALRQLSREFEALTLFIASSNLALADHYFPDAEKVPLDMPHLRGDTSADAWTRAYAQLGKLASFDLVLFLRRDRVLDPVQFAQWTDGALFIDDRPEVHQAQLEHAVVSKLIGPYDIEATFKSGRVERFPLDPRLIVFAPGSGFPHKKWSPLLWSELGQMLQARDVEVRILSGPREVAESAVIARALGLSPDRGIFVGGSDFKALDQWLDECDVVVAADGGSAHICATRKPILGVFGPSPYQRYAPIGAANRVITRNLACSPCVGFDMRFLNACMSRECLYGLRPQSVLDALFVPARSVGDVYKLDGPDRAEVHFGVSAVPAPA